MDIATGTTATAMWKAVVGVIRTRCTVDSAVAFGVQAANLPRPRRIQLPQVAQDIVTGTTVTEKSKVANTATKVSNAVLAAGEMSRGAPQDQPQLPIQRISQFHRLQDIATGTTVMDTHKEDRGVIQMQIAAISAAMERCGACRTLY